MPMTAPERRRSDSGKPTRMRKAEKFGLATMVDKIEALYCQVLASTVTRPQPRSESV